MSLNYNTNLKANSQDYDNFRRNEIKDNNKEQYTKISSNQDEFSLPNININSLNDVFFTKPKHSNNKSQAHETINSNKIYKSKVNIDKDDFTYLNIEYEKLQKYIPKIDKPKSYIENMKVPKPSIKYKDSRLEKFQIIKNFQKQNIENKVLKENQKTKKSYIQLLNDIKNLFDLNTIAEKEKMLYSTKQDNLDRNKLHSEVQSLIDASKKTIYFLKSKDIFTPTDRLFISNAFPKKIESLAEYMKEKDLEIIRNKQEIKSHTHFKMKNNSTTNTIKLQMKEKDSHNSGMVFSTEVNIISSKKNRGDSTDTNKPFNNKINDEEMKEIDKEYEIDNEEIMDTNLSLFKKTRLINQNMINKRLANTYREKRNNDISIKHKLSEKYFNVDVIPVKQDNYSRISVKDFMKLSDYLYKPFSFKK